MHKKGVVGVVLLVLLLLTIIVSFAYVFHLAKRPLEQAENVSIGYRIVEGSVKIYEKSGLMRFDVVRESGGGNSTGFLVSVWDNSNHSISKSINARLKEMEGGRVVIAYGNSSVGKPDFIILKPFITSFGKNVLGSNVAVYYVRPDDFVFSSDEINISGFDFSESDSVMSSGVSGGSGGGQNCAEGYGRECYTGSSEKKGIGVCKPGVLNCNGLCDGEIMPSAENCDNELDDDCDGASDEGDDDCGIVSLNFPYFAFRNSSGQLKTYTSNWVSQTNTSRFYSDEFVDADIRYLGNKVWNLEIRTKNYPINNITFPYDHEGYSLDGDSDDEFVLYPLYMGAAYKLNTSTRWAWKAGLYYPRMFAPLAIAADEDDARIFAAANWPPKTSQVYWTYNEVDGNRNKMMIVYREDALAPHAISNYRALISVVHANMSRGEHAWQKAANVFKFWIKNKIEQENLTVDFPAELKNLDGFLNVQLENSPNFTYAFPGIQTRWNDYKEYFPLILFWGQMSNYADPDFMDFVPWNGTTPPQSNFSGVPPIQVGEDLSCCLVNRSIHVRYIPDLINFAANVKTEGKHIGYYSRPRKIGDVPGLLTDESVYDGETNLEFYDSWLDIQKENFGANAYYLDTLGGAYYGDALSIARLVRDHFPDWSVIEMPKDIYPAPFLISGSVGLGQNYGGSGKTLQTLNGTDTLPFPGFGRYILDDKIMFLGESNGDYAYWGQDNGYWTERQAFLLGAKFDVMHPEETQGVMNKALSGAIVERSNVGWWEREPKYFDTEGISNVASGVEIRRFVDKNGVTLLAVDNHLRIDEISFNFFGEPRIINAPDDSDGLPKSLFIADNFS